MKPGEEIKLEKLLTGAVISQLILIVVISVFGLLFQKQRESLKTAREQIYIARDYAQTNGYHEGFRAGLLCGYTNGMNDHAAFIQATNQYPWLK